MPIQAKQLLALQELDSRLAELTRRREGLDDGTALKKAAAAAAVQLAAAEKRLQNLEAEQRAAELELKSVEEKKAHEERRLYSGRITVPRELQAIEQEIAMLGRQRGRLDEKILLLMDEVESWSAEVARLRTAAAEARQTWETHYKRYVATARRLDAEIAAVRQQRAEVAAQIEPAVLRAYDDIRSRAGGIGAVRLTGNLCSGCRTNVSVVLARQVEAADRYVRCESCNRFLLPDPDAEE